MNEQFLQKNDHDGNAAVKNDIKNIDEFSIDKANKDDVLIPSDELDGIEVALKDGSYFFDAKKWFLRKYTECGTQNVYILIIAIIVSMAATISVQMAFLQNPSISTPFPIYVKDNDFSSHHINKLGSIDSVNVAVAKYIIKYYVDLREGYGDSLLSGDNVKELLTKISNLSSMQVSYKFFEYIDPQSNPDSPLLKCQFKSRYAIVQTIIFDDKEAKPNSAKVFFQTVTKNFDTNTRIDDWVAIIRFDMNDIYSVFLKKNPMKFIVLHYETKRLSDALYD